MPVAGSNACYEQCRLIKTVLPVGRWSAGFIRPYSSLCNHDWLLYVEIPIIGYHNAILKV